MSTKEIETRSTLRPRFLVPAVLLLALLAVMVPATVTIVMRHAEFCGAATALVCVQKSLRYAPWFSYAQFVLAAAAMMVAMIARPLTLHKSLMARLWPLHFLVVLAVLLYACITLTQASLPTPEALQAGTVSTSGQLWFLLTSVALLPSVLTLALAWLVIARLCFSPSASVPKGRSKGRLALLFFLVFAAVPMELLTCLNAGLVLFSDTDYRGFAGMYSQTTGISIPWGILLLCVTAALPVWMVAYLCDSGRRYVAGTLLAVSIALVLSLAFGLLGVLAIAIFPHHATSAPNLMQTAWLLLIWIGVANAIATFVACMLVRPQPSGASGVRCFIASRWVLGSASVLVAFVAFGFWGVLLAAKLNWTGPQPRASQFAQDPSLAQAASPSGTNCAGIVRTASVTWLLGNNDDLSGAMSDIVNDPKIQNLALGSQHVDGQPPAYRTFYPGHTVLSRLEGTVFKPVAYVRGIACLIPVPDTSRALLLTSLQPSDSVLPQGSHVIFETMDDGQHWQVTEPGMFAKISEKTYQIDVDFRSKDRVWAWRGRLGEAGSDPSGFGFSSDSGRTAEPLPIPADFPSSPNDIANLVPKDARASIKLDNDAEVMRFVTEVSPDQAVLWVSQRFTFPSDAQHSGTVARTDALILKRTGSAWQASSVKHFDDLYIEKLMPPKSGEAYAVISHDHQEEIAQLDSTTMEWQRRSAVPNPLWPLGGSRAGAFWATKDALVVTVDAEYIARSGTSNESYFDEVRFSADASYYSNDGGRHWHKLAIASYPGIYGLDQETSRLYFRNFNKRTGVSPFLALDLAPRKDR